MFSRFSSVPSLRATSFVQTKRTGCASATEKLTGCEASKIIFTITSSKMNDLRIYGVALITFLLIMALIGTGWVIKLQIGLFALLVATIISFCAGIFVHEGAADTANGFVGFSGLVKVADPNNATSFSYASNLYTNLWPGYTTQGGKEYNFFSVFAIFFPAVTGIMAGANISGLLQNPSENIPKGTFTAIFHSTIVYCFMAFLIGAGVTRETLLVDNLIMAKVELASGILVLAGVYAATFSSALASLVGAPQLLIAVAKDAILPFSSFTVTHKREGACFVKVNRTVREKGSDRLVEYRYDDGRMTSEGDPVRGYFLTFFLTVGCILIGELNAIAPLISMFFMMTYGLINIACFALDYSNSPGWRPEFQYYSQSACLFGALLCVVAMFLTDVMWAIISFVLAFGLFLHVYLKERRGEVQVTWGTALDARVKIDAMRGVLGLRTIHFNAKIFRPSFLVLTGVPSSRMHLCRLAWTLRKGYGGVILGNIVKGDPRRNLQRLRDEGSGSYFQINPSPHHVYSGDFLGLGGYINSALGYNLFDSYTEQKRTELNSYAPLDVIVNQNFRDGCGVLLQNCGLGALRPNVVVMGFKEDWKEEDDATLMDYVGVVQDIFSMRMGCLIVRNAQLINFDAAPDRTGTIDVWWLWDDGGLTMLLPHIMTKEKFWQEQTEAGIATVKSYFVLEGGLDAQSLAEVGPEYQKIKDLVKKFRIGWETESVFLIDSER